MPVLGKLPTNGKALTILSFTILLATFFASPRAEAVPVNAPVPYIQQISPIAAIPGGGAFTLTVGGVNFTAASVVYWAATPLTTVFVSSVQLTATVPAPLTASSGTGWITVATPAPGGGKSNLMFLPVQVALVPLTLSESRNAGSNGSWGAISGDFNNDGKLDVITSDRNGTSITVFLGNGDGTFQIGQIINISNVFSQPFGLAVGDVNNDGNLDVVVTSLVADPSGGIALLLGNGNGTFQNPVVFTDDGGGAASAVLADVNSDGKLDLLVGAYYNHGGVEVFLGNGDGTFQTPVAYGASAGGISQVLVADMNADGILDLVVSNESAVSVLLGNGDGSFQSRTSFGGNSCVGIAIADFDDDSKLDVACATFGSGLEFFQGNGDGTLQAPVTIGSGTYRALQVGDLDGDGKLDLIGNNSNGTQDVYLGNGDGSFQSKLPLGASVGAMYNFGVGNFVTGGGLGFVAADDGSNMLLFIPTVQLAPNPFDFSSVTLGSSSPTQTFTLTNGTGVTVNISAVTLVEGGSSVDFKLGTNTCSGAIASGASCTIDVSFVPTTTGALAASLQVTDDAPGGPHTAWLSGTGSTPPDFTLTVLTATQTIAPGGTANVQVTVTPQGGFASFIALACSGAPSDSICSIAPSSVTPSGSPINVTVTLVTKGQSFAPPFSTPRGPLPRVLFYGGALCLLAFLAASLGRGSVGFGNLAVRRPALVAVALLLAGLVGLAGCNSGGGVRRGSYTLTITGASGSLSHTSTTTVVVH